MKQWERDVIESRDKLWLVTTTEGNFTCVKFRSRFFVKDCAGMLPVKGDVINSIKL